MEDIEEMSTKISDLNNENIKDLSENIQKELDEGVANNYMNSNLEELQQLQLKQLQELQKIQETQLKQQVDSDDLSESESEQPKKKEDKKKENKSSTFSSIKKLLQEPLTILLLYVFLSHDFTLNTLGGYIPSMVSEDGTTLKNLVTRGIILVSVYFIMKMFVFN